MVPLMGVLECARRGPEIITIDIDIDSLLTLNIIKLKGPQQNDQQSSNGPPGRSLSHPELNRHIFGFFFSSRINTS